MKRLAVIFLLFCSVPCFAQKGTYIIFEERAAFDTIKFGGMKLLYNHVQLYNNENKPRLEVLNLYFSKDNFKAAEFDGKTFSEAATDYQKLTNDVLITLTPLGDSLQDKLIKVSTKALSNMTIMKPEELLQEAIKNLHSCFSENDMRRDAKPGIIKTLKYKLLIKKGNAYYLVKTPILTEYYLIDKASYLYPSQYHYGEINVQSPGLTSYVSGQDVFEILQQHTSSTTNNYYPIRTVSRRTYLSNVQRKDSCNIYTYWTYPGFTNDMVGIGKFQFIEGVGIVNGTYGTYLRKNFMVEMENNPSAVFEDFNGSFTLVPGVVNGLELAQYLSKQNNIAHQ